ncbi:MAG TPA: hypothetical protein VMG08_20860 [Allosphingosinicella sp.]|nr:hypothetical protein [Allosphingosinicella sp.]
MKTLPIAAVALLFGTSAYAMPMSTAPTGAWVDKDPHYVTGTAAVTHVAHVADGGAQLQPATTTWWGSAEPVAWSPAKASFETGDDVKAAAMSHEAAQSDEELAEVEADVDAAAAEPATEAAVAELEPAAYETIALDEAPVPIENGVGGPDEHVDIAAADLSPRPAAQNYPACRPGPGDDACIQLYEPGVPQRLAAWTQPTGGFAGDAGVRMAAADEAMTNDTIETAMAEDAVYEPVDGEDEIEV